MRGLWQHFLLSLRLNARNRHALAYGYLMPVFFLFAFASVFAADTPPLRGQMGQLLVITILGGACFGLPTTLVSERERGVWRRYRLLPIPVSRLVVSALLARLVIVVSAAALQIVLARLVYGTPWPEHGWLLAVGVLASMIAFLGLGLLVAALANDVPSVQGLGQAIFLPMILIGGVGVPLAALPVWAQRVAGFMPGRYAVEWLQAAWNPEFSAKQMMFDGVALVAIGVAAGIAGIKLFRWEPAARRPRGATKWALGSLAVWLAVGGLAWQAGRLRAVLPEAAAWETIAREQIERITYEDLPGDNEVVTRLAPPLEGSLDDPRAVAFAKGLQTWQPGRLANAGQSIRNLVALAAIADLCQDRCEAEMARLVFDRLRTHFDHEDLTRGLAWVILAPDEGTVVRQAPELGLSRHPPERAIRQRSILYAQKFLGRIEKKIDEAMPALGRTDRP